MIEAAEAVAALLAHPELRQGRPELFGAWAARKRVEILAACFPKQRAFIEDQHRGKAVLKTRRAGGSYVLACYHLCNLLGGGNGAYIGPTAKQARRIMWNGRAGLKAVGRRFGLSGDACSAFGLDFNNTEMIATLRGNGANVMLGGAETRDDCEKYRGEALKLATIDEPASIKEHLEYLVDEVLEPTLLDEDGTICMVGTPGRNLTGTFYEVTTGQRPPPADEDADEELKYADWSVHRWSVQDNIHLPRQVQFLARVFRRHGWSHAAPPPRALREYFGLWVREESTLVYKFSKSRNVYTELPRRTDWEYGLSIDLGSDDATAFRVTMFSRNWPIAYGIELAKARNLTPSDIAERIKGTRSLREAGYVAESGRPTIQQGYAERYRLLFIVVDTGGLGKMVVQELNDRHLLSPRAEPAEKTAKLDFIEHFNDDLLHGRYQVAANDAVIPEWETLQWAEDETKRVEDQRQQNDGADATLYGWRRAKHYWAVTEVPPPAPGTAEALNAQAREWEEKERAQVELENGRGGKPWWDYGGGGKPWWE